jgi:hypothetical protein
MTDKTTDMPEEIWVAPCVGDKASGAYSAAPANKHELTRYIRADKTEALGILEDLFYTSSDGEIYFSYREAFPVTHKVEIIRKAITSRNDLSLLCTQQAAEIERLKAELCGYQDLSANRKIELEDLQAIASQLAEALAGCLDRAILESDKDVAAFDNGETALAAWRDMEKG